MLLIEGGVVSRCLGVYVQLLNGGPKAFKASADFSFS